MSTLLIEYRVDDFAEWKAVFDQDPMDRGSHGVIEHRIYRDVDDDGHHLLAMNFRSPEEATAFREALRPVWEVSGIQDAWVLPDSTE